MTIKIKRGALPTDNFTMIPNAYARDRRLSWGARGLLSWLMSHAASFKVTEELMIAAGGPGRGSGRDGVRGMVAELEAAGYLRRDKTFTPGIGTTVDYVLTDPDAGEAVVSDAGEAVVSDDQANQEDHAGQPYDGKAVPPSYREDQEKTKTPSVSKRATATRVPDDFQPTEEMRAWFVAEQLPAVIDGRLEHEKFMDYWRAAAGANARKRDWPATWRNWMRRAAQNATPRPWRPGNAAVPISGAPYQPGQSTTNDRVMQGLALVQKFRLEEENKA